MSEWLPIETCPVGVPVLVAFHGHGKNRANVVTRRRATNNWDDWDYINSHDGAPKYWMPIPEIPDDIAGPDCSCDGCIEAHHADAFDEPEDAPR